jgi:hypothetical protein
MFAFFATSLNGASLLPRWSVDVTSLYCLVYMLKGVLAFHEVSPK